MGAQVIDHQGGVWSIAVPIPDNPLGHTLVHLLETERGPVLIDTGWDDPDSWDTLVAGVSACGFTLTDLHGVLITHHHPDHHGLSAKVREASGAWIAMHAADTAVVRRTRAAVPGQWLDYLIAKLVTAGAPDEHVSRLREARSKRRSGRQPPGRQAALPDRDIAPGELLDLPGRRLRAVWTPGHTPGHVCLHLEEEHPGAGTGTSTGPGADAGGDAGPRQGGHGQGRGFGRLFSGDHLLPGITPHIGLYEDPDEATATDPLSDYLDSLERVARLAPAEVLPAHQHTFTDAGGRVRELIAHHEERLSGLRALLREPLTPWELAVRMEWNRPWEQIPYASRNIAVSEAEAHLRCLVKLGQVEQVERAADGGPARYQAV